jgi:hypothetical protein
VVWVAGHQKLGAKSEVTFSPSGGTYIQSVCFEPCATLIRRTRRTPGRLDAHDDEDAPAVCGLLLTARCGYKTVVFQCYDHVICVSTSFLPPPQRENLEPGKAWGRDLHGIASSVFSPQYAAVSKYGGVEGCQAARSLPENTLIGS